LLEELPDPRDRTSRTSDTRSVDKRREFEKLSEKKPSDIEAERAFLRSKIELVRLDPNLADDERTRFIKELQERLESLTEG
jgi:hypothetical protein